MRSILSPNHWILFSIRKAGSKRKTANVKMVQCMKSVGAGLRNNNGDSVSTTATTTTTSTIRVTHEFQSLGCVLNVFVVPDSSSRLRYVRACARVCMCVRCAWLSGANGKCLWSRILCGVCLLVKNINKREHFPYLNADSLTPTERCRESSPKWGRERDVRMNMWYEPAKPARNIAITERTVCVCVLVWRESLLASTKSWSIFCSTYWHIPLHTRFRWKIQWHSMLYVYSVLVVGMNALVILARTHSPRSRRFLFTSTVERCALSPSIVISWASAHSKPRCVCSPFLRRLLPLAKFPFSLRSKRISIQSISEMCFFWEIVLRRRRYQVEKSIPFRWQGRREKMWWEENAAQFISVHFIAVVLCERAFYLHDSLIEAIDCLGT